MRTVAFCEIDPYCRAVLRKHWPDVPCFENVRELDCDRLHYAIDGLIEPCPVDVIAGGFPCQDVSSVGRRAGIDGPKSSLYREYIRLIAECRPSWALMENSARGARHWVPVARAELAALGYESIAFDIAASDIGANHERNRGFVLANSGRGRCALAQEALCAGRQGSQLHPWWSGEPSIPRVDDGLPAGLDRRRVLGNAVVPQIAEAIGRAIMSSND